MNEPANDNGKKPRKQRAKGPKAPNKKAFPGPWAEYQLDRAKRIVNRIHLATLSWTGAPLSDLASAGALITSAARAFGAFDTGFKAPRKRRAKKGLTNSEDSGTV